LIVGALLLDLGLKMGKMVLQKVKPFCFKRFPGEIRLVYTRSNNGSLCILMSFGMAFSNIDAFSSSVLKGARQKECAKVVESIVTVMEIASVQDLLGGTYSHMVS